MTSTIYFAIEESLRELDSRLLLAAIAAERGIAAIIGQQWLLMTNMKHLPPGIVVFKGNNKPQHEFMKAARRNGHLVASIEEEALGVAQASQILRLYDQDVDQTCHIFLAQGEFHRQTLLGQFPGASERIIVVGNPRMDFLRPEFLKLIRADCDAIRNKFGPFVLINTNIADINSGMGDALASYEMCIRSRYITEGDSAGERDFDELVDWEHANAREVAHLVKVLREAHPETTIVLRPHPSERIETWETAFAGLDRVHVERGGSHLPWTLACDILVHTGCTTGMEAFVAGQTAISLCPGSFQWHTCLVSNQVNRTFPSHCEAARFVIEHQDRRATAPDRRAEFQSVLDHHVFAPKEALAADLMIDALTKFIPSLSAKQEFPIKTSTGFVKRRQASVAQELKINTSLDDARMRFVSIQKGLGRFHDQQIVELGQAIFQVGSPPQ